MSSYLLSNYLAGEGEDYGDAGNATISLTPAAGESLGDDAGIEMITLPGGIMLPKKTAMIIIGIVVAAAIILYVKKRKPAAES